MRRWQASLEGHLGVWTTASCVAMPGTSATDASVPPWTTRAPGKRAVQLAFAPGMHVLLGLFWDGALVLYGRARTRASSGPPSQRWEDVTPAALASLPRVLDNASLDVLVAPVAAWSDDGLVVWYARTRKSRTTNRSRGLTTACPLLSHRVRATARQAVGPAMGPPPVRCALGSPLQVR